MFDIAEALEEFLTPNAVQKYTDWQVRTYKAVSEDDRKKFILDDVDKSSKYKP
jgi:hypothetical protein